VITLILKFQYFLLIIAHDHITVFSSFRTGCVRHVAGYAIAVYVVGGVARRALVSSFTWLVNLDTTMSTRICSRQTNRPLECCLQILRCGLMWRRQIVHLYTWVNVAQTNSACIRVGVDTSMYCIRGSADSACKLSGCE